MNIYSHSWFVYYIPEADKKNLFRKTEQYFLDTLHIWEAAITP